MNSSELLQRFRVARPVVLAGLCLFAMQLVQAADLEPIPDAPPPLPASGADNLEPEVTIIRRGEETVEEYRVNGQLYMIKVQPGKGVPYYLMDTDGDGNLDSRRDELDPKIMIPHWVIFKW